MALKLDLSNNPKTVFEEVDETIWKKEIDQSAKEKAIHE